eukprot:5205505-Prymnesium_polylepis.1
MQPARVIARRVGVERAHELAMRVVHLIVLGDVHREGRDRLRPDGVAVDREDVVSGGAVAHDVKVLDGLIFEGSAGVLVEKQEALPPHRVAVVDVFPVRLTDVNVEVGVAVPDEEDVNLEIADLWTLPRHVVARGSSLITCRRRHVVIQCAALLSRRCLGEPCAVRDCVGPLRHLRLAEQEGGQHHRPGASSAYDTERRDGRELVLSREASPLVCSKSSPICEFISLPGARRKFGNSLILP